MNGFVPSGSLIMKLFPLFFVLATAFPESLAGQVLEGRIRDGATGEPLTEVWVEVVRGDQFVGRALSDSIGHYSIELSEAGTFIIHATRFGYERSGDIAQEVGPGETVRLDFDMVLDPVLLDEIVAVAKRDQYTITPGRVKFSRRALNGKGVFLDPMSIAWEQVSRDQFGAWDLIRVLPGIWPTGEGRLRSTEGTGCLNLIFNDWPNRSGLTSFAQTRGTIASPALDDVLVSNIAAIEVYREYREVPDELKFDTPFGCGLINVWTWGSW